MGEFLEYVKQVHYKLKRRRGSAKPQVNDSEVSGDEITGEFNFSRTIRNLSSAERQKLTHHLKELRAI